MRDYIDKCQCHIHSLDGGLAEATILDKIGNNLYLADYNGVQCTAIFNCFVGKYYVDDVYGAQTCVQKQNVFSAANVHLDLIQLYNITKKGVMFEIEQSSIFCE